MEERRQISTRGNRGQHDREEDVEARRPQPPVVREVAQEGIDTAEEDRRQAQFQQETLQEIQEPALHGLAGQAIAVLDHVIPVERQREHDRREAEHGDQRVERVRQHPRAEADPQPVGQLGRRPAEEVDGENGQRDEDAQQVEPVLHGLVFAGAAGRRARHGVWKAGRFHGRVRGCPRGQEGPATGPGRRSSRNRSRSCPWPSCRSRACGWARCAPRCRGAGAACRSGT